MEGVMDIEELVYETLLNTLEKESALPWVTPVFVPGHPCFDAYCDMQAAYDRLQQMLNITEEDAAVEEIINSLLKHGKILAMEMFRYGRIYQQTQDNTVEVGHC